MTGPTPSSTTRVAAGDRARLECASEPAAPGVDKRRRRVAAQGAAGRTRVRGCSPCPQDSPPPRCSRGLGAAARSWTRPGRPRPTAFPLARPAHSSATYWGSARDARRGRGPASDRLRCAGDPKLREARGAAATFQVGADRSSRRRAAEGGLGTWAPL